VKDKIAKLEEALSILINAVENYRHGLPMSEKVMGLSGALKYSKAILDKSRHDEL
jgi:hypothetical protein